MSLMFYPHEEDLHTANLDDRLEVLMDAAEKYKAVVLDAVSKSTVDLTKRQTPKDILFSFNWDEAAKILREIRELAESTTGHKGMKVIKLRKLADVYEVLRGARMPKLEAVRIALMNEASQLAQSTGVA